MANKIIAICDFDNFNQQNVETLLFSNILEKKYDSVAILDHNSLSSNKYIKDLKFKEKAQILTANVFNITSYNFIDGEAYNSEKALNLARSLANKNEILIINTSFSQYFLNTDYFKMADEIVIFSKLSDHIPNNLLSFFMLHKIENKKIYLYIINQDKNIQNEKSFISLRKQLSKSGLILDNISSLPYFKSLDEIRNVDPWLEIYKKINSTF